MDKEAVVHMYNGILLCQLNYKGGPKRAIPFDLI